MAKPKSWLCLMVVALVILGFSIATDTLSFGMLKALPPSAVEEPLFGTFSIATTVHVQKQDKPVTQTLSIFHGGKAYDFLQPANEIAIFDPVKQQITLINVSKNKACELSFNELNNWITVSRNQLEKQLQQLSGQEDVRLQQRLKLGQFLLNPKFHVFYESAQQRLKLASPYLEYNIEGTKLTEKSVLHASLVVQSLHRYWDLNARLNRIINPGGLPASVRSKVNEALSQHKLLPDQLTLKIRDGQPDTLQSLHRTQWNLTASDMQQVENAERFRKTIPQIDLEQYLTLHAKGKSIP